MDKNGVLVNVYASFDPQMALPAPDCIEYDKQARTHFDRSPRSLTPTCGMKVSSKKFFSAKNSTMRDDHSQYVSKQVKQMDFHERLGSTILEVFSESDFHAVGIRDIAKKAGVSFATIYKHYGNKERLVFTFVDIWMGSLTDRIIDHLQGMADLKEKLRKIFWLQLEYYEHHSDFAKIIFMTLPMKTWMTDESFEQRRMFNLLMDVLRQGQDEGVLNANVDARILLDFMLGFVQRSFIMWVQRGQKESLAEQTDVMFEMVWRGIVTPERLSTSSTQN